MKARVNELRRATRYVLTCSGRLREVTGVEIDDYGYEVPSYATRYEGNCLIYPADRDATVVEAAAQTVPLARYTVLFPHDATVKIGYVFDVTESPDNPALVGEIFRISDAPLDAWSVLRHCMAERPE